MNSELLSYDEIGSMPVADRDSHFQKIWDRAYSEGLKAGESHQPTPMTVFRSDLTGKQTGPSETVSEGACGFAWVNVSGKTSRKFINWMKSRDIGSKDHYYGGWTIWIHEFGQSHERKRAMAHEISRQLKKFGVSAFAMDRLD